MSTEKVKSNVWTPEQLHNESVTFLQGSGLTGSGSFTALRLKDGMAVFVDYFVNPWEKACRAVTQKEIDKLRLHSSGPTKYKMF